MCGMSPPAVTSLGCTAYRVCSAYCAGVNSIPLLQFKQYHGVVSPEVVPTGSGKATVCRNGHCIQGTWKRPKVSDLTVFEDRTGDQIPLQPGNTWVELVSAGIAVTT